MNMFLLQNCQAGLNFSSEDEAMKFKKAVDTKLHERRQKRLGTHEFHTEV